MKLSFKKKEDTSHDVKKYLEYMRNTIKINLSMTILWIIEHETLKNFLIK